MQWERKERQEGDYGEKKKKGDPGRERKKARKKNGWGEMDEEEWKGVGDRLGEIVETNTSVFLA